MYFFHLASESDRNETNSSSDSYDPVSCNGSYDEVELAKVSNNELLQVDQPSRANTSSASSDPRTYFALADCIQSQTNESITNDESFCTKGHDLVERNKAQSNVRNSSVMNDVYIDDTLVCFKKDMHDENNDAVLPTSESNQENLNVNWNYQYKCNKECKINFAYVF